MSAMTIPFSLALIADQTRQPNRTHAEPSKESETDRVPDKPRDCFASLDFGDAMAPDHVVARIVASRRQLAGE